MDILKNLDFPNLHFCHVITMVTMIYSFKKKAHDEWNTDIKILSSGCSTEEYNSYLLNDLL